MTTTDWYAPLRNLKSLGSSKAKIAHRGELAAARKIHLGQFFTPDHIAAFMFRFIANLPVRTLLDNSIGSGRLFQFADPAKHELFGVDVHPETVSEVMKAVSDAGFECTILQAGMQFIKPRNFDACLINPPFSIHLESQSLERFEGCTCMGRLGPDTSAMSEVYALRQALKAAAIVIALMPTSKAIELAQSSTTQVIHRLRAVYHLPKHSFDAEGTDVDVSVMVFGDLGLYQDTQFITLNEIPDVVDDWRLDGAIAKQVRGMARLGYTRMQVTKPAINLPVTGNNRVTVHLDGRRIKLKFACGLTQAKVLNQIYVKPIFSTDLHRLPKGVAYAGQGRLDLMAYLVHDDPLAAFDEFMQMIRQSGGDPVPHVSVLPAIRKRVRECQRAKIPYRRTVWSMGNVNVKSFSAVSKKCQVIDPTSWSSPTIKEGDRIEFTKLDSGAYQFSKNGKLYELGVDRIESTFDADKSSQGWQTIYEGKQVGNQQHATLLRQRASKLGIDKWLSWKFQLDDLIEIFMQPASVGTIAAWEQACGKSRLAAALILMSGAKHGLIVVESRLIAEMLKMLAVLPIDQNIIHVIDSPQACEGLKTINLISYERLRMAIKPTHPRMTYAKRLRRRIGIVIPDEAEKLANMDSDQSRALFQLSARRRIPMSGTPVANYPRDILGLMLFVGGDATPIQPYGYRRGYLSQTWLRSMTHVSRGIEQLASDFVVLEWATSEFLDTLNKGAKREVPKIKNLDRYRSWLSPLIKRRLTNEPEVEPLLNLPPIYESITMLEWEPGHLAHYLVVADEFANWYKQENDTKGSHNLAILLARIQAVHMALNAPQVNPAYAGGLTSKQTHQIKRLVEVAQEGKKSLLFCNNPSVVDLLHRELKKRKIDSVKFTGKQTINARNEAKEALFIHGDVPHLLATMGCARSGQNLPQADYVFFYDRCWSYRTQDQAIKRPRRTERKLPIQAEFIHLPGSLDIYQHQLVEFKRDATQAGIDWATPELNEVEFLHLTTVLDRFVNDLAKLHSISASAMRDQLKVA